MLEMSSEGGCVSLDVKLSDPVIILDSISTSFVFTFFFFFFLSVFLKAGMKTLAGGLRKKMVHTLDGTSNTQRK